MSIRNNYKQKVSEISIKHKSLILVAFIFMLLFLLTIFVFYNNFVMFIGDEENEIAAQNYYHFKLILEKETESIESAGMDWAYWDNVYQFIEGINDRFIEADTSEDVLEPLKLNFMYFMSINRNNKYFLESDLTPEIKKYLETDFLEKLYATDIISRFKSKDYTPVSGLVIVEGNPVLISVVPTTDNDKIVVPNGFIILGRLMEDNQISYMEELLQAEIAIGALPEVGETNCYSELIINKDRDNVKSLKTINDIFGNLNIQISISFARVIYQNGLKAFHFVVVLYLFVAVLIGILCMFFVDRVFIRRLRKIQDFIILIGKEKNTKTRIELPGNDEISALAEYINETIEMINITNEKSRIMEERFNLVRQATNDGYFEANVKDKEIYINPEWLNYIGYKETHSRIGLESCIQKIHPEDKLNFINALSDCLSGNTDNIQIEYRIRKQDDSWLWIMVRGKVLEYDECRKPLRITGSISDISKRKSIEEENIYLSKHDRLTSLKNRNYFEPILEEAERYPGIIWIIMGDLNGLKIINDTFGHVEGDKFLSKVGNILKECCNEGDIPVRWGGDEFLIYIQDKDEKYVDNLINKINKGFKNVSGCPIRISMAIGRARKEYNKSMEEVLREAEEIMYRRKLLESRSIRSAIISSLENSLHEKHIETEEHTKRLKELCVKFGERIGLTVEEIDELTLLGALHDIGKIGISETILLKPGPLTEEEWVIMKRHCEIGYRITVSIPELAHIAEKILAHHERYDGKGYPRNISGNDIPKLARILAIIDAFDVMTNNRIYRKAITAKEAMKEIEIYSGTQFDPELAKLFLSFLSEMDLYNFNQ